MVQGHSKQLIKSGLVCRSFLYATVAFKKNSSFTIRLRAWELGCTQTLGSVRAGARSLWVNLRQICFERQSLASDLGLHFRHLALSWMLLCRDRQNKSVVVLGGWGLTRLGYAWKWSPVLLIFWGQPQPSLMLWLCLYEGGFQRHNKKLISNCSGKP